MALSNPAFSNTPAFSQRGGVKVAPQPTLSPDQLTEIYNRPAAGPTETDRMSYDDVIVKTVVMLVFLLAGGAVGAFIPALALPAAIVGFVLALVNIFKKKPSPVLIIAYSIVEGVFLGGISVTLETLLPGIILQAVAGTLIVFAVTLALFANGKVRASGRATKVFMIAGIAYAVFSLMNFVLQLTGVNQDPWGLYSAQIFGIPLGLIIGPLAILMAAYSLVLDFTSVKQGVESGAPRSLGWKAAFGLVLTIVWLYIEFLRLIAIFRGN
jgi:uncharacterized YccA/Bax inhibitor family protein